MNSTPTLVTTSENSRLHVSHVMNTDAGASRVVLCTDSGHRIVGLSVKAVRSMYRP